MTRLADIMAKEKAQIWINHDKVQAMSSITRRRSTSEIKIAPGGEAGRRKISDRFYCFELVSAGLMLLSLSVTLEPVVCDIGMSLKANAGAFLS